MRVFFFYAKELVRSMLKINGVSMPTPTDFQVGIMDITEGERNANGTIIIELIATKRKLEPAWKHLSRAQLQLVTNAIKPVFFTVEYPDPETGEKRSGTFYKGDRIIRGMDYINGEMLWSDCKFNMIER